MALYSRLWDFFISFSGAQKGVNFEFWCLFGVYCPQNCFLWAAPGSKKITAVFCFVQIAAVFFLCLFGNVQYIIECIGRDLVGGLDGVGVNIARRRDIRMT